MNYDNFGNRMKEYEEKYTSSRILGNSFLCARLDGKNFSSYTRGFEKPFDFELTNVMIHVTEALVKETHASHGYTQSDEISLFFTQTQHEHIFGGKVSKLNSILASMASAHFNSLIRSSKLAYFDCRSFAIPSALEASALCRWTCGHKNMQHLNQEQMKYLMRTEYGVNWEDLAEVHKYGSHSKRKFLRKSISEEERLNIPERYRPEEGTIVNRTKVVSFSDIGYFGDWLSNDRVNFILM